MKELELMLEQMKQPEYVHVLLNPMPVYGLAMGCLALALGLLMRNRLARIVGLILIVVGCASVWPVVDYGYDGYDRVYAMSDSDAQEWLNLHRDRAARAQWGFYLTGLLALAGIVVPFRWSRTDLPLAFSILLATFGCLILGGWISHAGGKVRHSEFRDGPPSWELKPADHKQDQKK